jgi:oligopeptidase A
MSEPALTSADAEPVPIFISNPLLDFSSLPRFAAIRPEHVVPAIDTLIAEARATIERIATEQGPPSWEGFVDCLDSANERLQRAWHAVTYLNAVLNSPALREAYNAALPKVTQYFTQQDQDLRLFGRFKALAASPGLAGMSYARKRLVDTALRDFRLGGAELPEAKKARFSQLQDELAALSARFQDNLLDATNAFGLHVTDPAWLAGIPEDVQEVARAAAAKDGREGWKLTLHMPCYLPVMQYADYRPLREQMYRAHSTCASEFGKPDWDNGPLIAKMLDKRAEVAALLGYESYAGVSLATKMAESPAAVIAFLEDLAARAKPSAEGDMGELVAFARKELNLAEVRAWDVPWVSEKLRQRRYAYSNNEVKRHFPEDAVLAGLFRVIETLYGVRVKKAEAETWHPDVKFFAIEDADGALVGQFYLDLYAREAKRGGAWMAAARNRRRLACGVQTPVTYLTCNFSSPAGGKPALFTHREVITLFHEFGHGLHQLLTRVDELGVSGLAGVEWDALELPSQFMENFCWEWDVLSHMTRHVDTGEPLPRELFDKMVAAKNFQSGMQFVRQIEFALFDMHLHHDFDRAGDTVLALLDRIRERVAVVHPPEWHRFANSFGHIFAGPYAAGYYSYKWAEVLSADAFAAFEEEGVLNAATGARFRDEVLGVGGSRPALESFVAFRGRKPRMDALLRHNGMVVTA